MQYDCHFSGLGTIKFQPTKSEKKKKKIRNLKDNQAFTNFVELWLNID